jgi:ribose 5-phosphate isomerase B
VTVVSDTLEVDLAALAPIAAIKTVAVAGDHTSLALKAALITTSAGAGSPPTISGRGPPTPVDYPDTAAAVAGAGGARGSRRGHRHRRCRAGVVHRRQQDRRRAGGDVHERTLARYARQHNGANVLALGSTLVSVAEAIAIAGVFLDTPMREARYIRRLAKIRALEARRRVRRWRPPSSSG